MDTVSYFLTHLIGIMFAGIIGSFIALQLSMLIKLGIQALFLKPFKLMFKELSIFGLKYYKNSDNKWERNGRSKNYLTIGDVGIDVKNSSEEEIKTSDKRCNLFLVLVAMISLIIAVVVFVGCIVLRGNITLDIIRAFVLLFGLTFLIQGITGVGITIYVISRTNSNTLSGYATRALNKYKSGVPLQSMDLKPEKELNFGNSKDFERRMYFLIYFSYCDLCEKFDELEEAVKNYEKLKAPDNASSVDIAIYINLVYYYSYHNIDPEKAHMYYERAGKYLDQDKDANGMRIKGFYQLNIKNDLEKAKECLAHAQASIDTFSVPVERENERILIARLSGAIDKYQG